MGLYKDVCLPAVCRQRLCRELSCIPRRVILDVFVFLLLVEKRVQNGVFCHSRRMSFQRSASSWKRRDIAEHTFGLVASLCYVAA